MKKTYPAIRWTVSGAAGEIERGTWRDCEDAWIVCFILAHRVGLDDDPEIRADGWACGDPRSLYIRTYHAD